jgi:hypothetical protein
MARTSERKNVMAGMGVVRVLAASAAVALSAGLSAAQTVITQWTFNSPANDANFNTGTTSPAVGGGVASLVGGTTSSFASGAASGGSTDPELTDNSGWQTTTYPGATIGNKSAGVQFAVSTCGFSDVVVSWDVRHSNSSSRYTRFQYTLNASAGSPVWVDGPQFDANLGGDRWYNARTVDLSAVTGASNNQNFAFRIVTEFAPPANLNYVATTSTSNYAGSGTLRYDMVTVSGLSAGGCGQPSLGALTLSVPSLCTGESVLLTVPAFAGSNPTSTGLTVRANLTALGGASNAQMFDNGTNGDVLAGDGVWSLEHTVPVGTTPALNAAVGVTVSDAQGRSVSTTGTLNVSDCSGIGQVVISQVYGGGGNVGAIWTHDFIELFNKGTTSVNVTGWAVQYASANGVFTGLTPLSGVIPPGRYYLIRQDGNLANGQPLPTPLDAIGIIGMSNAAGRVALTTKTLGLTDCFDTMVSDLVAYGSTTTTCYEGIGTAPGLNNTSAAFRFNNGCQDTNENAADFYRDVPAPRNSASAAWDCTGIAPTGVGSFDPSAQCAGDTITFRVDVTPGSGPASTGLEVRADLSAIGGSSSEVLVDQGGIQFAASVLIPATLGPGPRTVTYTVRDAQGRITGGIATATVQRCQNVASGIADPAAVCASRCGSLRLVVFVNPADTPLASGIQVVADLSALGGSGSQTLFDDGSNGDYVAFDNTFAVQVEYPQGLPVGAVVIPYTVTDAEGRTTTGSITLPVVGGCEELIETVRISQVYGGGGNTGALWRSDFVELYNASDSPVDLTGWSVQYASASGNFTQKVDLAGGIGARGFYLVQLSLGAAGLDLPTPDAVGSFGIDNNNGKIALVSGTGLIGSCADAGVEDVVGYGAGASCFEGAGAATSPSNTLAIFRLSRGCVDTNNNSVDFATGLPDPFNTASPAVVCESVPCAPGLCGADYNRDGFLNLDDLGDFITDFYTVPAIPGGLQPNAPTYSDASNVGYGVPCEFAGDAEAPYAVDAYRVRGFRVGYSSDGSNSCPFDPSQLFPNLDNLNDYITYYYGSVGQAPCN